MSDSYEAIRKHILGQGDALLCLWRSLVNAPSPARKPELARTAAEFLAGALEGAGGRSELVEAGPETAPVIIASFGERLPGAPVILSGHYDTVSLPDPAPFSIDARGWAHGLGCLDMKGGIVIALAVARALSETGLLRRPLRLVFVGDEERGHMGSRAPEILVERAAGALCALNMETGLPGGEICVGRKGGGEAHVTVTGTAAHAGADFRHGRNAIEEMAHEVLAIQGLTDVGRGTTVSVTMIEGGTVPNSIPPVCSATVDVRYESESERERVKAALEAVAGAPHVAGCSSSIAFEEFMPPFEPSSKGLLLAAHLSRVSERLGYGAMGTVCVGGGSDAAYLSRAGIPTVCSMGVRGEHNHTSEERAEVSSLFERAIVIGCAILSIDEAAPGLAR